MYQNNEKAVFLQWDDILNNVADLGRQYGVTKEDVLEIKSIHVDTPRLISFLETDKGNHFSEFVTVLALKNNSTEKTNVVSANIKFESKGILLILSDVSNSEPEYFVGTTTASIILPAQSIRKIMDTPGFIEYVDHNSLSKLCEELENMDFEAVKNLFEGTGPEDIANIILELFITLGESVGFKVKNDLVRVTQIGDCIKGEVDIINIKSSKKKLVNAKSAKVRNRSNSNIIREYSMSYLQRKFPVELSNIHDTIDDNRLLDAFLDSDKFQHIVDTLFKEYISQSNYNDYVFDDENILFVISHKGISMIEEVTKKNRKSNVNHDYPKKAPKNEIFETFYFNQAQDIKTIFSSLSICEIHLDVFKVNNLYMFMMPKSQLNDFFGSALFSEYYEKHETMTQIKVDMFYEYNSPFISKDLNLIEILDKFY